MDDYVLALVVISTGPLFVDIRKQSRSQSTGIWELDEGTHCQLYLPASSTDQHLRSWPAIGKAYDIPLSIEPTESGLRLATSWLEECLAGNGKHQHCASAQEPPHLPARVIDVGSSPGADPRLHISEGGEMGHYVALSHCWGGSAAVMCTRISLPQLVEKFPAELPKTFADAIAVTRALGQKYLWIDSFCIMQDSMEDWARESQRMDQVYSHALFTIMADAAEDSLSGFLEPPARNTRKHINLTCEAPSTNDAEALRVEIHLRQRGDLAYQLPYHDFRPTRSPKHFDDKYLRSKLSTRAWAFQERLLSPRTLHFAPSEMAWECRGMCNCECSATNERTRRTTSLLKGSIALVPAGTLNDHVKSRDGVLRTVDHAWQRDIVEEYTKLSITKDTDRPFGIAGLATKALALRSGDQYLAGLWRKTLVTGLSWSFY
ncbi:heterokaryon incompatibility protein-domain-containing protein [Xylaria grammica]|nr:heterokaryon incompatibility protein-domain-containing protein [Xylaria grammica]